MDVDLSGDGRTILFDLVGDLHTVPAGGGEATQLTRGLAINFRPVWSPDGKKIACISDYSGALHVNVRELRGGSRAVLGGTDEPLAYSSFQKPFLLWSPDGHFVSVNDTVYGLTGSKLALPAGIGHLLRFSGDGQLLYFVDSGCIWRYDRERRVKTVISPALADYQAGILSPDGHYWVYVTDSIHQRWLIAEDLVGHTRHVLVGSLLVKYPHYLAAPWDARFCFSGDSKEVLIGYGGKIHRIAVQTGRDVIIPFRAQVKVDAGPLVYNQFRVPRDSMRVRYMRSANGSPDGKQLVFSALSRIYVMDLPHGKPHPLCPQPVNQFQPVWSPDGQWIAYVSWCDTVGGYLWRVRSGGGEPERLTPVAAQYQNPAWSPDGTTLAVITAAPELAGLYGVQLGRLQLIDVRTKETRTIADSVPVENELAFSADGSAIIYQPHVPFHMVPSETAPFLVSRDIHSGVTKVLAAGWIRMSPQYIDKTSLSPDGKYIVYSLGEDLYLLPVCGFTDSAAIKDQQLYAAIRIGSGVDPYWEHGGSVLAWTYGNRFYRIDPGKVIAAADRRKASGAADSSTVTVAAAPDAVVEMDLKVAVGHGQGALALTGVRIITMQGDRVIENGTIVIRDGRIAAVGAAGSTPVPKGAQVLQLPNTTVMPGLIDTHLHTSLSSDMFVRQSWKFLTDLAYGVTTMRDPSYSFESFGYGELLESGQMTGPRLYSVGCAVELRSYTVLKLDNAADAQAIVDKRAAMGAVCVKQYLLPTRLQRQWLLQACQRAGLNMTNEGPYEPLSMLAMLKDGSSGVEHSPDWGDAYSDMVTCFARSGTVLTPTLQSNYGEPLAKVMNDYLYWNTPDGKMKRFIEELPDKPRQPVDTAGKGYLDPSMVYTRIRQAGGVIALGSHGNEQGIGVHNELWSLQAGGLTNLQALQEGTIMGARALGIQQDVGSIEVGKIADLLVLKKNPLADIHNSRSIRYVMKAGILYDGGDLKELWPVVRPGPEWRMK